MTFRACFVAPMVLVAVCVSSGAASAGHLASDSSRPLAQALRICVDRWNEGNMISWGPTVAHVEARPRCAVTLAIHYRRPRLGCAGNRAVPGHPRFCLNRSRTYMCVINRFGAYVCPANADTGQTPLKGQNARTNERGVLRLDFSVAGTRTAEALPWQRNYPHVDGWVYPWGPGGRFRSGLRFTATGHGPCTVGSEQTSERTAISCRFGAGVSGLRIDPCFRQQGARHRAAVAACPNAPGDTTFTRFRIVQHPSS